MTRAAGAVARLRRRRQRRGEASTTAGAAASSRRHAAAAGPPSSRARGAPIAGYGVHRNAEASAAELRAVAAAPLRVARIEEVLAGSARVRARATARQTRRASTAVYEGTCGIRQRADVAHHEVEAESRA